MGRPIFQTAKVFPVFLDRPLAPLSVEPRYREALLIVISEGQAIGQFFLPALDVIPVELQRAEIISRLRGAPLAAAPRTVGPGLDRRSSVAGSDDRLGGRLHP